MTTNEFIKMLQKADPFGNGHIRLSGGFPVSAQMKEGYWDGPYSFIDKDGNYVTSIEGYKVDVTTQDIEDYVEQFAYNDSLSWEDIKKKIVFKFDPYSNKESRDSRSESILKEAKEAWDRVKEVRNKHSKQSLDEMRENADKGWNWFQNKLVDIEKGFHIYYTWHIYDETGKQQGSNPHSTECVQKSGEWERLDDGVKEGYYHWVKIKRWEIK